MDARACRRATLADAALCRRNPGIGDSTSSCRARLPGFGSGTSSPRFAAPLAEKDSLGCWRAPGRPLEKSVGRDRRCRWAQESCNTHAARLSERSTIDADGLWLWLAQPARGIAAAFNTPLGGVIFAIEQLSHRRGVSHSGLVIISIVMAGLVAVSMLGNLTYFGELRAQRLELVRCLARLIVTCCSGLAGGLFWPLMTSHHFAGYRTVFRRGASTIH